MPSLGWVTKQLVYWAQVQAGGTAFDVQNGPAALTVGNVASVYTITMPANFTVPVNRRMIVATLRNAVGGQIAYDEAASAANTVVIRTFNAAGAAANSAFMIEIFRVEFFIGAGAG